MKQSTNQFEKNGQVLEYIQCKPEGFDKSKPIDVIYGLHGVGGNGQDFDDATQLCPEGASENSLVIIPSALNAAWKEESIELLKGLSQEVNDEYDVKNTHLVGHSMGGQAALKLFCDNEFSAQNIFAVSTSYDYDGCNPASNSNIHLYHYNGDAIVPQEGGPSALPIIGDVVSQEELTQNAAIYNGCDTESKEVTKTGRRSKTLFSECGNGTIVEHEQNPPSNFRPHRWQEGQTDAIMEIIKNNDNSTPAPTIPTVSPEPTSTPSPSFPSIAPSVTSGASSTRADIASIAAVTAATTAALVFGSTIASFFNRKNYKHTQRLENERETAKNASLQLG